MRPRILVVDGEILIRELLCIVLEDDYQVICASTRNEAILVLAAQSIDVILLDYHLPDDGAVQVVTRADEIGIPTAWMIHYAVAGIKSRSVLLKPFQIDRLSEVLIEIRHPARSLIESQMAIAAP